MKLRFVHRYLRWGLLAVVVWVGAGPAFDETAAQSMQDNSQPTSVTLRWGTRPGVSRYRLQLANDAAFSDIVFDRVLSGHEYRLDLEPGKYYWRIAPLNAKRGEFSSAGVIDVPPSGVASSRPTPSPVSTSSPTPTLSAGGGWFSTIGKVESVILAHLKASNSAEIVAATADGRITALDGNRGIALWSYRMTDRPGSIVKPLLLSARSRSGGANILTLRGSFAALIEGISGRELWRSTLPGIAVAAAGSGAKVFVIDNSLRKLILLDANSGSVVSTAALPRRAVGAPLALTYRNARAVMVALDDGGLHVVDEAGKLVIAANAGSPATTSPLLVRTARGELVLVGTQSGLTALTADGLVPLGRVALKDDSPRGTLWAQDLDSDSRPEVVMFTSRGKVMVVKSDEGKIVWEADARRAESAAFADVNGDRVLDLLMAGREGFAFALSGRDGAVIWKDDTRANIATNHSPAAPAREAFILPTVSGVMIIAADPNRTGLRAVEFPKR